MEKATALIKRAKLPKSCLIADGDETYATYKPPVNLCFTPRNGKEVFVFTGRKEAEIARKKLLEYGTDCSVVVVTFDELLSHAKQCNGIALDLPTYDRELFNKEIAELLLWRNYNGPIFVQLKKE